MLNVKVLFLHTRYREKGGELSVVNSEIALLKSNGIEVKEIWFSNFKFTAINLLLLPFNIFSYIKVLSTCMRYKPDIVHIHNMHFAASPSVIWAIDLMNITIVNTLHNYRLICPSGTLFHNGQLYFKSLHKSFAWQAVKDKVYRNSYILTFWLAFSTWLHRKLGTYTKVDKFIVFTEQGRELISSNTPVLKEQIMIKPNFTKRIVLSGTQRTESFLYVGRLFVEKGISTLLKAFATNGLPITIIGDGPLSPEIELCKKNNPLINWIGFQQSEVINAELKKCSALILPSVCYEGMPVTIIEAFASGTPVIASKLGAMERMIKNEYNGLLFEPGNAEDLNVQLHKWNMFKNNEKAVYSHNAVKTYEEVYTPEINIHHLMSIYDSALLSNN